MGVASTVSRLDSPVSNSLQDKEEPIGVLIIHFIYASPSRVSYLLPWLCSREKTQTVELRGMRPRRVSLACSQDIVTVFWHSLTFECGPQFLFPVALVLIIMCHAMMACALTRDKDLFQSVSRWPASENNKCKCHCQDLGTVMLSIGNWTGLVATKTCTSKCTTEGLVHNSVSWHHDLMTA
eukprot:scpid10666/ scgid34549/ 